MSRMIVWHRRDLRITDHWGLHQGMSQSRQIVGLFCLDPAILQREDTAPVRVRYLLGCLAELQVSYRQAGSRLLIFQGDPVTVIPQVALALQAKAVIWNWDVEPYARSRDRAVLAALHQAGISSQQYWDQLLHAPETIYTGNGQPYTVYTPFWRKWQAQPKAAPLPGPAADSLQDLSEAEIDQLRSLGEIALPKAADLGFAGAEPLCFTPGEAAALQRLTAFCGQALLTYQEDRNIPSLEGTSGLSAALKLGAIGIRTVWAAAEAAREQCRSDEALASIQTWQQELAWREFYQHALYAFPQLADGPYRPQWQNFPWDNRPDYFQAWCEGQTGYPIVDAAMRQLNETGWMHNRCRMIVANFLTKDLIINWQWGEKYFMQRLIDGDLAANNGGWQWSASSGMDPRPLRIFNPASQAQKFDSEADYIRQWLPELRGVDTADLVTGHISPLERRRCGYPQPIVDHHRQQKIFKERYQQQVQKR